MYKGHANALKAVAAEFNVTVKDLVGASRTPSLIRARRAACMVLREYFQLSSVEIGKIVQRDHTTVLYTLRKCRHQCDIEVGFREAVSASLNRLRRLKLKPCSPRETVDGSCMGIGTVCISP